ncbi:MAG: mechanosensitive ion channel family protein, partial [Thermaurantiacus sp.]
MASAATEIPAMPLLDIELFQIAGQRVTLAWILAPVIIIVATLLLASVVNKVFTRLRRRAAPSQGYVLYVLGQLLRYGIVFAGVIAAGSAIGLNLTSLSLFAGALGVGIGLGLQDIVRNFTYGILLLFDRSVEVGDYIELANGTAGQVVAIGPRATTITTNDNVDILIPNAELMSKELVNWTRNHTTRRVRVPFSVAYGSDKELVKQAALEAARNVPFTMPETEQEQTQVWLTGFGDSALEFQLIVWPTLDAVKRRGRMLAAYRWALDDSLRKHGLEIPFPQRDIRVRSLFGREEDDALATLAIDGRGRTADPHEPQADTPL